MGVTLRDDHFQRQHGGTTGGRDGFLLLGDVVAFTRFLVATTGLVLAATDRVGREWAGTAEPVATGCSVYSCCRYTRAPASKVKIRIDVVPLRLDRFIRQTIILKNLNENWNRTLWVGVFVCVKVGR